MTDYGRKLDERRVQAIRRAWWSGGVRTKVELARRYDVSPTWVGLILRRGGWVDLPLVENEPQR